MKALNPLGIVHALLAAIAIWLAVTSGMASAATQCASRDSVVRTLADKYGETQIGIGMAANNSVAEIYTSPATGTWTMTITMPNGMTCLVASGQSWEQVEPVPPPQGEEG